MWEHYRKTFVPIQIVIIGICIVLHFKLGVAVPALAIFIVVMEVFSLLGSLWALRLRRKVEHARGRSLR